MTIRADNQGSSSNLAAKIPSGSRNFKRLPAAPHMVHTLLTACSIALVFSPPEGRCQATAQPTEKIAPPAGQPSARVSTSSGLLAQARQLIRQGQAAQAVPVLQQYTSIRPQDPDGHFWLGLALDESGSFSQAIWAYSKSLDLGMHNGMDSAELRINIGNTLMRLDRPVDAIFNYRRAIEIEPKQPGAHLNLGRALINKGEAEEALKELSKSYELGLNDPMLHYYKALAYRDLGKTDDARSELEIILNTLPNASNFDAVRNRSTQLLKELSPDAARSADPSKKP